MGELIPDPELEQIIQEMNREADSDRNQPSVAASWDEPGLLEVHGDEPLDAIHNHIKAFLNMCETNPAYVKVWLEWSCSIREDIWPQYIEFQNKLLDMIAKQIDKAIKKGDLAPGLSAPERARWLLGNSQMLVSMAFDPSGKPRGMNQMVDRGVAHILGAV